MADDRNTSPRTYSETNYDRDIDNAKNARNNQLRDTDPRIEKEGFLGIDDLDRLRRRKIKKIF